MFKDISKFNKISDYLPILNGSILADIIIILGLYYTKLYPSKYLKKWYENYRLSAVVADVLILVIGKIIVRSIYDKIFKEFSILKFIFLILIIQIIHDILFYFLFTTIPRGYNKMLDLFKDYAKEVSYGAIIGDSSMIIMSTLLSSIFANLNINQNIILNIFLVYLIPYIIYIN